MKTPLPSTEQISLSRRQSLKLFAMMVASATLPGCIGQSDKPVSKTAAVGHWPTLTIEPVSLPGYGQDPNLIIPPSSAWPKTLTTNQLALVSRISDVLLPAEGTQPGALGIGAPSVVDEWVSAPYSGQQRDRDSILRLLIWLDEEAQIKHQQAFLAVTEAQQKAILDTIAFGEDSAEAGYELPARAFNRLRELVLAAYFCSVPGSREIGYMGNVAISGDYPGPTEEAKAHLDDVLAQLGLSEYAYTEVG
ncbi:gluconate 2-dehydrogenase subunit 3 family protein [Alteromonas gilva]|uniref:Gluconate 2-dehydrogenase subunit 3 family protein n=1 Tax=Alteromonas gilva TaxID=2987522 RepID=A0ABT5KXM2_9ALTE|nr:gluconate 2-dehydrogenase subunit 3 family protein [Alteromonas gilva]MDC8829515.1 gluconate 2-dehydrogenase subunit 3 family protein [Alteromonas gilva]